VSDIDIAVVDSHLRRHDGTLRVDTAIKLRTGRNFSLRFLYALAAPSTPVEVRPHHRIRIFFVTYLSRIPIAQKHGARMQFGLKNRIQNVNGYADQSFTFLEPDARQLVGDIASIDLIENGDRPARENWQKRQLSNLINHAYVRSNF
jgi:hypothetical protein